MDISYLITIVVLIVIGLIVLALYKDSTTHRLSDIKNIYSQKLTYSEKIIKSFDLKGASHQNLNRNDRKICIGKVKTDKNNAYDKYAISVYNDIGKQVGYLPAGNQKLFNTLNADWNGETQALIDVFYEREGERWWFSGTVIIPILYKKDELESILKIIFFFYDKGFLLSRKKHKSGAYELFDQWSNIKQTAIKNNFDISDYPSPDPTWVFKLSTDLYNENDFKRLLLIEKHTELIDKMSDHSKKEILKRFEVARNNLITTN